MLLWRLDPLERDWQGNPPDPERTFVDGNEASPDYYRALKRAFEDVAETDPKPRTLLDWRDVAKREGLRYHEWIDEYEQARIEELPADADAGDGGGTVNVRAGATTKRNKWTDVALKALWQESILPDMTQKVLAEKFGVTHQSISKQLKRASERFSKTKSKASAKKKTWLS